MLLSRHARRMMVDGRLRALGRFTKALSFPLSLWLAKERCGSVSGASSRLAAAHQRAWAVGIVTRVFARDRIAMVDNYERTFRALHRQFRWPLPGLPTAQRSCNVVVPADSFRRAPLALVSRWSSDVPERGDGGQVSAVGAASITSYGRDFRQDEKARELAYVAQRRCPVRPILDA